MYLLERRTLIAVTAAGLATGVLASLLDFGSAAYLLVGLALGSLALLTDPVGFGLREDPQRRGSARG